MATINRDPQWRFDAGGDVITDTAVHTGRWLALQALGSGCTLDAGTDATDLTGAVSGLVVPAGAMLHGRFNAVQLSGGSAVAYR